MGRVSFDFSFVLLALWMYRLCNFGNAFSSLMHFLFCRNLPCHGLACYCLVLIQCLAFDTCRRIMRVVLCVRHNFSLVDGFV